MSTGSNQISMQIGEVAKLTALSVDAIRFYERNSLLPKVPRTAGHFRLYSQSDVARLTFIQKMHNLGFSLREVRQILDIRENRLDPCREVSLLVKTKLAEIRSKIRELKKLESELIGGLRKCDAELRKQNHVPGMCPVLAAAGQQEGSRMLIEVLYIPGCSNHRPAVERVRRILATENVNWPVVEIPISDEIAARSLQFPGSPTVRINGMDVEPIRQGQSAFACRLYSDGSGLPSEAVLQRAISAARYQEQDHGSDHTRR